MGGCMSSNRLNPSDAPKYAKISSYVRSSHCRDHNRRYIPYCDIDYPPFPPRSYEPDFSDYDRLRSSEGRPTKILTTDADSNYKSISRCASTVTTPDSIKSSSAFSSKPMSMKQKQLPMSLRSTISSAAGHSPSLVHDWESATPSSATTRASPNSPFVLPSAFEGLDDIDVRDNPIEHVLPPEIPATLVARRPTRSSAGAGMTTTSTSTPLVSEARPTKRTGPSPDLARPDDKKLRDEMYTSSGDCL